MSKRIFFFRKGQEFTGKYFTGSILVTGVDKAKNQLHVALEKDGSKWPEIWNLEHTEAGIFRGDYTLTKDVTGDTNHEDD